MEPLTTAQKELYDWLVEYIRTTQHAPSIRQMMKAMKLKSPAPVQSRLERLRNKGYIDWSEGKARTIRILHQEPQGLPILGAIAAGGLVEPFTDVKEKLDLSELFNKKNHFALKVVGDSMIGDHIAEGDMAIVRKVHKGEEIKNGEIVAARVTGLGTTLKRFYSNQEKVILKPANPNYPPIEVKANNVEVQGILVGVWRGYQLA
ncbi:MAG: transcriptional repressor LexA [Oscillatoria sp. PMC 1051.18]|uniref:transcriptional repressor LexA n=1 Tax=Oscillatoria salina TaxID=331517 RepID=UPI0013BA1843|nr:transcriptional repressor LexA [Oscillatoria salina]MBZ8179618.1 repressor LexA [Oscillatoria salina IIICB1]MEC4892445.1 transcriptional repressor LexA [Oscillatoria sp. PMC 1050.18]MEC5028495.1 transcriptional repressor LexA [Oscillatoria sp. PMC 1051.18]NET90138.1 repressor LexA [Kamptonema sp. SIO1D9]